MRNNHFPGWARPYEFAAELLTGLGKREEEARDMARRVTHRISNVISSGPSRIITQVLDPLWSYIPRSGLAPYIYTVIAGLLFACRGGPSRGHMRRQETWHSSKGRRRRSGKLFISGSALEIWIWIHLGSGWAGCPSTGTTCFSDYFMSLTLLRYNLSEEAAAAAHPRRLSTGATATRSAPPPPACSCCWAPLTCGGTSGAVRAAGKTRLGALRLEAA
jgi:hypothetical protein